MKKRYIILGVLVLILIPSFIFLKQKNDEHVEYIRINFYGTANHNLLKSFSAKNTKITCDNDKEYQTCFIYTKKKNIKQIEENKKVINIIILKPEDRLMSTDV